MKKKYSRFHHLYWQAILVVGSIFVSVLANPSRAAEEVILETSLKEGTYSAIDLWRLVGGLNLLFEFHSKKKHVVGVLYSTSGTICFEGGFSGNVIRSENVVNLDRDYLNGNVVGISFSPLREGQKGDYSEFRPQIPLSPFPDRRGFTLPPDLLFKKKQEIRACAVHFGEKDIPAPCGNPALRFTDQSEDPIEPKYRHSGVICYWRDGDSCTVQKVFEAMLETPGAVAPVALGRSQVVTDCGELHLLSGVGVSMDNKIVTDIDIENHMITNYTLPGHDFYPGSVIRYVTVGFDGVRVNVEGRGTENPIWTWINIKAAPLIWDRADEALRRAFETKYRVAHSKKK